MPKILVDLDNTLCATSNGVLRELKKRYNIGPEVGPYMGSVYNFEEAFPELRFEMLESIFLDPKFYDSLVPFNGASKFTKQLGEWGEVIIATDRRWLDNLDVITKTWLDKHSIWYNRLVISKGKERDEFAAAENVDVAIDDKPDTLEEMSEVCPVIAISWPYNKKVSVRRAESYMSAAAQVMNILGESKNTWKYVQSMNVISEQE